MRGQQQAQGHCSQFSGTARCERGETRKRVHYLSEAQATVECRNGKAQVTWNNDLTESKLKVR